MDCLSCPLNTFKEKVHRDKICTPCPAGSLTRNIESILCQCEEHHFRVPGEQITSSCFTTPQAPEAYEIAYQDSHTAYVNWSEPIFDNRTADITYQVQCIAGCRRVTLKREWSPQGTDRSVLVSLDDVWTKVKRVITIRVYSLNGASAAAGPGYAKYLEIGIKLPMFANDTDSFSDPSKTNIFQSILDAVGVLGILGIVIGSITLCCLVFCLITYVTDDQNYNRPLPIKILGQTSSPNSSAVDTSGTEKSDNSHTGRVAEYIRGHFVAPTYVPPEGLPTWHHWQWYGVSPALTKSENYVEFLGNSELENETREADTISLYFTPPSSRKFGSQKTRFKGNGYGSTNTSRSEKNGTTEQIVPLLPKLPVYQL